jgi:predicted dienelactone hydrolase
MAIRILSALAVAVLCAAANCPKVRSEDDSAGLAYKPEPGPFQVQTIRKLVLNDAKRNKELQVRIQYPAGKGPFPVIVWSHGAGGSKDNYTPLTEYWASHGFITIQPTHSDSRSLAAKATDPVSFRDWQSRPADISFILDSLSELEKREPALQGHFEAKRIGVGGHSFGANTAQLTGGAKAFLFGGQKSFADPRVTAVMLLSGQGPGEMLRETSWESFTRPMLVMTGSADGPTRTGQPAAWRKKPYELSPPGDKYLVWVEGLDHGFGGITGVNFNPKNRPNPDHVRYTKIVTLAFWDAYLNEKQEARAYIESDKLQTLSRGALRKEHK